MTPFPTPLAANYLGQDHELRQPVALIAVSEDEFLAIDFRGAALIDLHASFEITDGRVNQAIWEATMADGS